MVTGYTSVVARQDQVSSDLAGEAVILDLKSGMYDGLDALLAKYFVESEQCDRILLPLLQALKSNG